MDDRGRSGESVDGRARRGGKEGVGGGEQGANHSEENIKLLHEIPISQRGVCQTMSVSVAPLTHLISPPSTRFPLAPFLRQYDVQTQFPKLFSFLYHTNELMNNLASPHLGISPISTPPPQSLPFSTKLLQIIGEEKKKKKSPLLQKSTDDPAVFQYIHFSTPSSAKGLSKNLKSSTISSYRRCCRHTARK